MSVNELLGSAATLELRRFIERGFVATAEVQAYVEGAEGPGGTYTDPDWVTVPGLEAIPCGFKPAAPPAEAVIADAERAVVTYLVKLPHGTPVTAAQRLIITHTEPGIPSPLVLDVVGPYYRTGEITRWVLCRLVAAGGGDGA